MQDAQPTAAEASAPVAERRVTSVLFADLVGFTPLSEARDPEEVRELLSAYFAAARTVIGRYGGTVEKFIGDAVMAVWGVPVAHEDDAERAVRAGLDLVTEVAALGDRVGAAQLAARAGIVTGEVAVTLGAVGEGMVAGDAVNTAARVQSAASPGEVWVDEATRALSAASISFADAGEHELKGKAQPLRLFAARAVVASVGGSQRVDGLEAPFIGRDRELRLVKELFHAAIEEGRPRMVAVFGAAGVGKSRLGWEFEKYIDGIHELTAWHRGRALSYGDGVAFWALAEMIRSRIRVLDGEAASDVEDKLSRWLDEHAASAAEAEYLCPRIAALLGLDSGTYAREELNAALTTFIERIGAGGHPSVLLFEDMQYADPSLLDFIEHLITTAQFPVFVLTLARPELTETRPTWGSGRRATAIYVEPLPDTAMSALIDHLVEGLPAASRAALVARSEGIPLYAVETVRALIDRDAVVPREGRYVLAADAADRVDLATLGAPASLQALIAARLDTLTADERRAVQDASVHGLAFPVDGLAATCPVEDLPSVLESLVRKEILALHTDRFSSERGQYRFVQELVRTVAYDTLSRRDRKSRHLAVANYLSRDGAEEITAVLARHYLDAYESGPTDPDAGDLRAAAAQLFERAATRAESLGSPEEALRHYLTALDCEPDPESAARLVEGAATAAQSAGLLQDAIRHAEAARAAYEELGRDVDAARAIALIAHATSDTGRLHDSVELLTPVYERLVNEPAAEGALLMVAEELARAHALLGQSELARPYAEVALRIAEAREDWARVVQLLSRYAVIWLNQLMPTGGLALLRAAVDLARRHNLPHATILPLANIGAFNNSRDLQVALEASHEALVTAVQVGAHDRATRAAANLAGSLWLAGRWDELPPLFDDYGDSAADGACFLFATRAAQQARGEPLEPRDLPAGVVDDPVSMGWARMAESVSADDPVASARLVREALDFTMDASGIDDDFCFVWPLAVEAATAVGDIAGAREQLALVDDAAPGLVTPLLRAQLHRLRALVTMASGDSAGVDEDLATAVDRLRDFGARFYLGKALVERARFLVAQGASPDAVGPLVAEARTIFMDLRATPWLVETEQVLTPIG